MNEIITISKTVIGAEEVNSANGRELWEQLVVKIRFADWIIRRVEDSMFIEASDFLIFEKPLNNEKTTLLQWIWSRSYIWFQIQQKISSPHLKKTRKQNCNKQLKQIFEKF